jgi:hypothetical protein
MMIAKTARRSFLAGVAASLLLAPLSAAAQSLKGAGGLLKDLLGKATDKTIDRIGKPGGFAKDQLLRIVLPGPLKDIVGVADRLGLSKGLGDALNSAAEKAMPIAKPLVRKAVDEMTIADAAQIITGGDDSATRYFQSKSQDSINALLRPIIVDQLGGVGAFTQFDKLMGNKLVKQAATLAGKSYTRDDLSGYVTGKASDGLFLAMAQEEKKLRKDPLGLGGQLLKGLVK